MDVGANRGRFLRDIVRVAPEGHHIAYEPVPQFADALRLKFPTVEVRSRALSNVNGQSGYVEFIDPGFRSLSGLSDQLNPESLTLSRYNMSQIETERLDDHLPPGWLPHFIKIDVEGAVFEVLEGAINTLRKAKPIVAFEHGRLHGNSRDVFRLLCNDVGLRMFNLDGEGPLDQAAFIDGLETRWNWVAHE